MSRRIFRRQIHPDQNLLFLPRQTEFVSVVTKGEDIVLYGISSDSGPDEPRLVSVLRVTSEVPDGAIHIGTVQVLGLTRLVFDCGTIIKQEAQA